MSIFTDNLKILLKDNKTTYAALSKELGISKNWLKYWETAGNVPNGDILLKIANHFGISVSALTGQISDLSPQNRDEEELLEVFRQLTRSGQRQLLGKAYELLDGRNGINTGDEAISPPNIDLVATLSDNRVKK